MFYDFYSKVKQIKLARWFIIALRIVLGLAFIYPGLPKALGNEFTILGTDSPIGYFFTVYTEPEYTGISSAGVKLLQAFF